MRKFVLLAVAVSAVSVVAAGSASAATTCTFTTVGTTMTLNGDCTTDSTISVPDGFTLDGDGYTITAVDPAGDHFRGAVVANVGTSANVVNVGVTASGLQDVCDAGGDRLRGILFDGASGTIANNTVTAINQGASGCQEGNGIEVRNFSTSNYLAATISGNTVTDYQKNGITVNGNMAGTVTDNAVEGAGPVNYIAQNGVQFGFGATGTLTGNAIGGNDYTPKDTVACGVLFFDATGVRMNQNRFSGNELNICNFGKGGGKASV